MTAFAGYTCLRLLSKTNRSFKGLKPTIESGKPQAPSVLTIDELEDSSLLACYAASAGKYRRFKGTTASIYHPTRRTSQRASIFSNTFVRTTNPTSKSLFSWSQQRIFLFIVLSFYNCVVSSFHVFFWLALVSFCLKLTTLQCSVASRYDERLRWSKLSFNCERTYINWSYPEQYALREPIMLFELVQWS
jgi:hypothetical protein